jgi:hypothetical protein
MPTVVALEYKGSFRISEPFDAATIPPAKMAAKLVYWKGRGENTLPAHWQAVAEYRVDRESYLSQQVKYDTLIFFRHASEAENHNPFINSDWLIPTT